MFVLSVESNSLISGFSAFLCVPAWFYLSVKGHVDQRNKAFKISRMP